MFHRIDHRAGHYALLLVLWAACCLLNLGGPTLWDIDEGLNAGAAREMLDSGNWVVPTFNYQLRTAKPALLYWLQIAAFRAVGVSEAGARLPSALAALVTVLVTYELGRRAFGRHTGLLAGAVLATSAGFVGAAHFANPDALLVAFTTLCLAFFFLDWGRGAAGPGWLAVASAAAGLAVLAKGPVGLVLPLAVTLTFLLWQGQLRRLLDVRLPGAVLIFLLVAVPWYVFVAVETRGAYLREFWLVEHIKRVSTAMEGHDGPAWYYLPVLLAGLVPWSVFLGPVAASAWRGLREAGEERPAVRFLVVWLAVYLVAFSVARTKLPNYILPVYPAAALLTARLLVRWLAEPASMPAWAVRSALVCLGLIGVGVTVGLLLVGGQLQLPNLRSRVVPGLAGWAWLGAVPLAGAAVAWRLLDRGRRAGVVVALTASAAVFLAVAAGGVLPAANPLKPARLLALELPEDQQRRDVRLGAYRCFQPSMVFYCRREVTRLEQDVHALGFLAEPWPTYLFVQERAWEKIRGRAPAGVRVVARHHDLYSGHDVVLVTAAAME